MNICCVDCMVAVFSTGFCICCCRRSQNSKLKLISGSYWVIKITEIYVYILDVVHHIRVFRLMNPVLYYLKTRYTVWLCQWSCLYVNYMHQWCFFFHFYVCSLPPQSPLVVMEWGYIKILAVNDGWHLKFKLRHEFNIFICAVAHARLFSN